MYAHIEVRKICARNWRWIVKDYHGATIKFGSGVLSKAQAVAIAKSERDTYIRMAKTIKSRKDDQLCQSNHQL